ncbi:hypothetical protein ES703_121607 [subsurface metagenome]
MNVFVFQKMRIFSSKKQNHNTWKDMQRSIILLCISMMFFVNSNAQWLTGYGYRKPIEVDESLVPGSTDLTDYPLLVSFTDPNLAHTSFGGYMEHANGYDVDFTASDGTTTLDFEIEEYDNTTGEFVGWVRIPTLSATTNTLIYLYYGNSSISTDPSTSATWNTDHLGVWHLHDNYEDATSNNNDGTATGTSNITGHIADGQNFNGSGDYIQTTSNELRTEENFSISAWFKADATDFSHHLIWQGLGTANGYGSGNAYNHPEMNISVSNSNFIQRTIKISFCSSCSSKS